jgi:serine/threonine protein kinase
VFEVRGYILRKQLGQGAGGRVFLGCKDGDCEEGREKAAIKVVNKRQNNAKAVRMARREHSILGEMPPHSNIVRLYHVVENADRLCLVMQFAAGGDLFDYVLQCGRLPVFEAWRIFRQLISAVHHIHKTGTFITK